jgi:hypothetical protein
MSYIEVSVKELIDQRTYTSSKYTCTVSRKRGWFGLCNTSNHLVITGVNPKYKKHWGFPTYNSWNSTMGTPSSRLRSGTSNVGYGTLSGELSNSITWEETVNISRGNSRQGSVEINVGVTCGPSNGSNFTEGLKKYTLKTLEIPLVSNIILNDPEIIRVNNVDYIRVSLKYTNPENFYKYIISLGTVITNSKVDTTVLENILTVRRMLGIREGLAIQSKISYQECESGYLNTDDDLVLDIPVSELMYNTTVYIKLEIKGKDNILYNEPIAIPITIGPKQLQLYTKQSDNTKEINEAFLKGNSNRKISEVWIKINNEIKRMIK